MPEKQLPLEFEGSQHRPVLYHEIIHALRPADRGLYLDGTVGAGGHAWGILQASSPQGRLLGLDVDPQALALAGQRLASFGSRAILRRASYVSLAAQLDAIGWTQIDGILLDLGLSSMQLDSPERGFSFQVDAPLDMRFDPTNPLQADEMVNSWPEKELARLIYRYGEEEAAGRIAQAIVQARPISTTRALADLIAATVGQRRRAGSSRKGGGRTVHPATRTFQAIRIAVNGELDALEKTLPQAVFALNPGGRLAVISFHSLEDRIVKQFFRMESRDCICPPRQPICTCGHRASIKEVNRRPITPSPEEITENGRARSARLRVAEKVGVSANLAYKLQI